MHSKDSTLHIEIQLQWTSPYLHHYKYISTSPFLALNDYSYVVVLVVNIDCHLDKLRNHLGVKPLIMFVRQFLDCVHRGSKILSKCGYYYPTVLGPRLNKKEKSS